jgi:ribosomal protein S18 acetylase RimI-like enzyme
MVIRNVKQSDAEPLAELAHMLKQPKDVVRFSQDIARYASGFYVAELDNGISGYLVMRIEASPRCVQGRLPVQLWRLFVSRQYQGKGVAAGLMAQAFAHARKNAHDVVWLGTLENNARAIAFYRKCGFDSVGMAQLHQGPDSHQDLIMSCALQ